MQSTRTLPAIHLNVFDKFLTIFNPVKAVQRLKARASLNYLQSSGFITPGSNKRTMRGWFAESSSADADSIPKLDAMRQGSRDLVMNSPIASAPLNREVTNAVGWGLILQSRIDRDVLQLSEEEAAKWERKTEREFRLWAESKDCDASRTQNFYELQALSMYNVSLSGDVFITLPHIARKLSPYSLALQVLEADRVSNPVFRIETNRLAGGIEVDGYGAPMAYYVRQPQNAFLDLGPTAADTWLRIPAFGARSGRRNVLHLFHRKRPGQRRGIPMLAPVIETLKQLSRLTEAELAASVINSFFTVFIKTNPVTGGMQEGYVPEQSLVEVQDRQGDEKLYEMGSGNMIELPDNGSDISLADPKRPNDHFEPFFMALIKQIGSCLDIPFEQMILHFQASYSAARAALLEAWKFYRTRRMWLSRNFCQPTYEEWLMEAVIRGRVSAPGFFSDPAIKAAWCGTVWVGPGQGQIDPLKETKAAELRLKTRLTDYETEYGQIHGGDWEKSMDRLSREKRYLEEKDLGGVSGNEDETTETQLQQIEDNQEQQ
jgi:lambda family phage portal protein